MNKKLITSFLAAVVFLAIGLWIWRVFDSGPKRSAKNMTEIMGGQPAADNGGDGASQTRGNRIRNENFTSASGEVASIAEKSLTINMANGGSAIVFYSETTSITKNVELTAADLAAGQAVVVSGGKDANGTITAATVLVREDGIAEQKNALSDGRLAGQVPTGRKIESDAAVKQPDNNRGFVNGDIESVDGSGLTIKLPDGTQTVVSLADDVKITKVKKVSADEILQGMRVAAMGTKGADGSIVAQMITIGNEEMPDGSISREGIFQKIQPDADGRADQTRQPAVAQ